MRPFPPSSSTPDLTMAHRTADASVTVLGADGRPLAGPPTRPLPRITLERRGDDLFATGVEV